MSDKIYNDSFESFRDCASLASATKARSPGERFVRIQIAAQPGEQNYVDRGVWLWNGLLARRISSTADTVTCEIPIATLTSEFRRQILSGSTVLLGPPPVPLEEFRPL